MFSPAKEFVLEKDSVLPIHRQIENWLRSQIATGELSPGAALPPRKELCEMLGGVSHLTIRQAVGSLSKEGLLFSVQGRGVFVADKKQKQMRIALVLPNIEDGITRQIARGVQEAFDEGALSDAGVVLFDSRHSAEKERQNIGHLLDLPLDGAIIFPIFYGDVVERLVRLKANGFPVVLVDCAIHGIEFDSVEADNYAGSYEVTRHLLQRGRKRIAWIGHKKGFSSAADRYEGYRDAIADFGLPFDRKLTFEIPTSDPTDPYEQAVTEIITRSVIQEKRRPDAIVCNSDIIAISCLEILADKGLKVPDDIAIVGFDDIKEARQCNPLLTTINQPMIEIGRKAAELIRDRILNKSQQIQNVKMPVSLVVRQSS